MLLYHIVRHFSDLFAVQPDTSFPLTIFSSISCGWLPKGKFRACSFLLLFLYCLVTLEKMGWADSSSSSVYYHYLNPRKPKCSWENLSRIHLAHTLVTSYSCSQRSLPFEAVVEDFSWLIRGLAHNTNGVIELCLRWVTSCFWNHSVGRSNAEGELPGRSWQ